ncbi:MAG TPA: NAD(P)-binding domain-containing protein [Micromonosporaceae bacterium]|nr:NAD(P)-binding domain-containing protein [Micromonosporaceae bacterium]
MNIGVLGTGQVGRTLATRLVELGHVVAMGTRDVNNPNAREWLGQVGTARGARIATFADAAAHGALVINATSGMASLAALKAAGEDNLHAKVLIDVSNPLDFSHGMPPRLSVVNTDSLAEQIQREFPAARVVKTLNTVNAEVMVHPRALPEETTMFVAGNDAEAKATVADLLRSFGWRSILDLGGIESARGMEMYLPLWVSMMTAQGTVGFNVRLVRA